MKPIVPKKYRELNNLYIQTGTQKILEVLFISPDKEFSLSDLAKASKVAKANIGNILKEFENRDLIDIVKLKNIWRIKAKQSSIKFIRAKIAYNLNSVYHSGLVDFLNDYFKNPKAIILFGSFRKGEDIIDSDIDIAIEGGDFKAYKMISLRELSEFEKALSRKIQLHLFNRKDIDINLFNNIVNGIVLLGFLEVKK